MKNVFVVMLGLFLVANIGLIYYLLFFSFGSDMTKRIDLLERRVDSLAKRDTTSGNSKTATTPVAAELTDDEIDLVAAKVSEKIGNKFSGVIVQSAAKPAATTVPKTVAGRTKYLPVGQGTIQTADYSWRDLPVEIEVNTDEYSNNVYFSFEGTLRIPSGNGKVEARLVDKTSGPLNGSEITGEGSDGVYRRSNNFYLGGGVRKLKVQMRTSMDYQGILENGKLKVTYDE
jgi:hypothetical protein